jgi:hypothetical protein
MYVLHAKEIKDRTNNTDDMQKKKFSPRHILLSQTAGTHNKSVAATYFLSVHYLFTKRFFSPYQL